MSTFSTQIQPARPLPSDELTAADLDGRLIVWRVLSYGPVDTRYGLRPKATVAVLVCDGDRAGERYDDWTVFGRLARELGEQAEGATLAARVESWQRGKHAGYALDYALSDADLAQARAVVAAAEGLKPAEGRPRTTERPAPRSVEDDLPF